MNLLEDHLVDLLLDVAASGENVVEREGLSIRHPAKFVLVGTGNPEEGELRPQLLDRFGMSVEVRTPEDLKTRIESGTPPRRLRTQLGRVHRPLRRGRGSPAQLHRRRPRTRPWNSDERPCAGTRRQLCADVGTDGLRGELTLVRAARALAALEGATAIDDVHLRRVAPMALRHRLRRTPLSSPDSGARVERAVSDLFGGSGERLVI